MINLLSFATVSHRSSVTASQLWNDPLGAWLRVHGALAAGEVADVAAYRNHVEVLRTGGSVYRQDWVYPYFPGWLQIEWVSWLVSELVQAEFWLTIRMVVVIADVLTCFALWWSASLLHGPARGRWAAAIYALSPIAVIISGYHGQFEAIPTLVTVVAVGLTARGTSPGVVGVLLGAAIAVKPYPAVVVPVFLRAPKLTWGQRFLMVAAIGIAVGGIVVLFAGPDSPQVIRSVAGYGGLPDQGLGGLLRSLWLARANNFSLPGEFGLTLGRDTRWLALSLMALTWLLTWRRSVARSSGALILAFLVVFGAVSTQYLVWPLAWLLLSEVPLAWCALYGIGVALGAIGFYLVYWPQIILGAAAASGPWPAFSRAYVAGELVSWLTIVLVYLVAVGRPQSVGRSWRPAVTVASIAVLVTAYPVVTQVAWLAGEWIRWRG